jgi:hypothetical protein
LNQIQKLGLAVCVTILLPVHFPGNSFDFLFGFTETDVPNRLEITKACLHIMDNHGEATLSDHGPFPKKNPGNGLALWSVSSDTAASHVDSPGGNPEGTETRILSLSAEATQKTATSQHSETELGNSEECQEKLLDRNSFF